MKTYFWLWKTFTDFYKKSRIYNITTNSIKSQERWHVILDTSLDNNQWVEVYVLPFIETQDSKLQSLPYRINHRILFTNYVIKALTLLENGECCFCSGAPETICHLFWDCVHIQSLWTSLTNFVAYYHRKKETRFFPIWSYKRCEAYRT